MYVDADAATRAIALGVGSTADMVAAIARDSDSVADAAAGDVVVVVAADEGEYDSTAIARASVMLVHSMLIVRAPVLMMTVRLRLIM